MGRSRVVRFLFGALLAAFSLRPADGAAQPLWGFVDELKGGVLLHDALRKSDESGSADVNLEALLAPLWRFDTGVWFLDALVNPRPMIGGAINTEGKTSQGYGGVDWLFQSAGGFFAEGSFGIAVHSGRLEQGRRPCTPAELAAGCATREPAGFVFDSEREVGFGTRWLFRESVEFGRLFGGHHALSLQYSHTSNAGIGKDNDGMDFVGIRYGYRF